MSKIRDLKPWPVMLAQPKKLTSLQIKANQAHQVALANTTNLTQVMAKLAEFSGDAVFLNAQELEEMVQLPNIDYQIVCQQIDDRNLASCGQGGYYHIQREILNQWKGQ